MKLTGKKAQTIVYDDHVDWESVRNTEETTGHSRWSIYSTAIFRHCPTNKYYRFNWSTGATEMQDERPFEYDKEVEVFEVVEKEVTRKEWVVV